MSHVFDKKSVFISAACGIKIKILEYYFFCLLFKIAKKTSFIKGSSIMPGGNGNTTYTFETPSTYFNYCSILILSYASSHSSRIYYILSINYGQLIKH